jgi:hypothetical protein
MTMTKWVIAHHIAVASISTAAMVFVSEILGSQQLMKLLLATKLRQAHQTLDRDEDGETFSIPLG